MPGDPLTPALSPAPPIARRFIRLLPLALSLAACSSSPGQADVEQSWHCNDINGARPVMRVRNLSCRPAAGDRAACDYEAMIGTGLGSWVRVRGEFRRYSGTGAWCFDARPATLPGDSAR
jgi:hypothetical protein